jgi:hypothetical protein
MRENLQWRPGTAVAQVDAMTNSALSTEWLRVIQEEYREIPGLKLTRPQAQRLWGLEGHVCEALLDSLIAANFLRKTPAQAYVLAESR